MNIAIIGGAELQIGGRMPLDRPKNMTEIEKAWLAAAVDGEGTIGFYNGGITKNGNKKWIRTEICICNTNKDFLLHAKDLTGVGNISVKHRERRKPTYEWSTHGRKIAIIIDQILPYLIIKKQTALNTLKSIELHEWGGGETAKEKKRLGGIKGMKVRWGNDI